MFRVYTDPSPCPRFLSRTSVSELIATCNNFLRCGRLSSSEVVQCACPKAACSHGRHCRLPKWPSPRITSDPSLRCSVNKTLSEADSGMDAWTVFISVNVPLVSTWTCGLEHAYCFWRKMGRGGSVPEKLSWFIRHLSDGLYIYFVQICEISH